MKAVLTFEMHSNSAIKLVNSSMTNATKWTITPSAVEDSDLPIAALAANFACSFSSCHGRLDKVLKLLSKLWDVLTFKLDSNSVILLYDQVCHTCTKVDLYSQCCEMLPEGLQDSDQAVSAQMGLASHQSVLHITQQDMTQAADIWTRRVANNTMELVTVHSRHELNEDIETNSSR